LWCILSILLILAKFVSGFSCLSFPNWSHCAELFPSSFPKSSFDSIETWATELPPPIWSNALRCGFLACLRFSSGGSNTAEVEMIFIYLIFKYPRFRACENSLLQFVVFGIVALLCGPRKNNCRLIIG